MSAHSIPRLSPEEFLEFERGSETKHEYFNGEIVDMPGGTIAHCVIVNNLCTFLNSFLGKQTVLGACERHASGHHKFQSLHLPGHYGGLR